MSTITTSDGTAIYYTPEVTAAVEALQGENRSLTALSRLAALVYECRLVRFSLASKATTK